MTEHHSTDAAGVRLQRKILLRLDDGSLIGRAGDLGTEPASQKVIRLSVDQAAQIGRATDKEVTRLQTILDRLSSTYGLPSAALEQARSLPPPSKKARLDPVVYSAPAADASPWLLKCREVLQKLLKFFGANVSIYYNPVDPKVLPDYYHVIKEPLFLKDVEQRLQSTQHYQQPDDFVRDIKHFFSNVYAYNPKGDPFRAQGEKGEEFFDQIWAATGYMNERGKRATAGLAAPKFDPERFDAVAKPKPSRSQGAAGKRPRDSARAANHEATSGKHGLDDTGRLNQARIQEMGTYLSREDLPDEHSQHLVSLLPPSMVAGLESGELELDFDTLDNETLLRIDAWLRTLPEAQAMVSPVQPQPSHSHARVDWDDDDDDDYDEEESEESD